MAHGSLLPAKAEAAPYRKPAVHALIQFTDRH